MCATNLSPGKYFCPKVNLKYGVSHHYSKTRHLRPWKISFGRKGHAAIQKRGAMNIKSKKWDCEAVVNTVYDQNKAHVRTIKFRG